MVTAAEYTALVVTLLAGLSAIGWPITHLLGRLGSSDVPLTAPIAGLCVVQVASWYWFIAGGRGLVVPTSVLLGAGVAASAVLLYRQRRRPAVDRGRVIF